MLHKTNHQSIGVRLTGVLLVAFIFCSAGIRALAQTRTVSLSSKGTVQSALNALKTNYGLSVVIEAQGLDLSSPVSVELSDVGISECIKAIFVPQNVDVAVKGNVVTVSSQKLTAYRIYGKVFDSNGEAVPGATVMVKGTTNGVVTDSEGGYTIELSSPATLICDCLGYGQQSLPVSQKNAKVDFYLESSSEMLDELVVVGYGTMRRSLVTNAVSKMSIDDNKQRTVSRPTDLLNGRIAGVSSFASSGALGAGEKVSIRGASSIQAGNDPLYVVDGVIIDATKANSYDFGEAMSPLAVLNTNDIESIEILKDAASAAIYGSRASNGVVVITTRSGQEGRANLRVNISSGINQFPNINRVRMSTTEEYLAAYNAGVANYNAQTGKSQALLELDDMSTTDWLSYAIQLGNFFNADISVSGGNKKTRYSVGASYNHNKGIIQTNQLDKFNFSGKINHQFAKWIEIGANMSGNYMKNHQVPGVSMGSMILGRCVLQRPFDKAYHEDGTYTVGGTAELTYHNPASILNEANTYLEAYRYIGSHYINLKFWKDKISFKNSFNADVTQNHDYKNYTSSHPYVKNFNVVDYNTTIRNITLDSVLNYSDSYAGGSIDFNAMLGHSYQKVYKTNANLLGKTVPSDSFDVIDATATLGSYGGNILEYAMESFFGRVNLSYKDRYIVTATLRADGSSKFAPAFKNRWGWFPSVSAGWNIANEDFMKNAKAVSDLKIRVSYGQTGNQAGISWYAAQAKMSSGYNYDGQSGIVVTDFGNSHLRWEKSGQWDAGFDLSFFDDRLSFIFDAYYKKTSDLLYSKPIQTTSGVSSIISNVGSIENKGIELTIGGNVDFGPVHWSTNFNISTNANKILSLVDGEDIIIGSANSTTYGTRRILRAGVPLGTFFLYKHDGIYQSDEEVPEALYKKGYRAGDIRYLDVNGDGNLNDEDCMPLGNVNPKFQGGWSNTFSWKGIDLNIFFTFCYGNDIYAGQAFNYTKISYKANSMAKYSTNYWTPGSGENWYPRPYYNSSLNQLSSDFFLHDGSFFRLRNISLAYNFPSKLIERASIKGLRVYFSVDNAFLATKFDEGWDPEVNTNNDARYVGVDNFNIPQPRVYTFGINLTL